MKTDEQVEVKSPVMESIMAAHDDYFIVPGVGDILVGTIIEKTANTLYVDLGNVGVGVIYGRELFDDLDTFENAKIGDPVQASILQMDNEDGYIELSLRTATRERSWEELRRKFADASVFDTEIVDANKGGLMVRINGVTGFLPVSQLAPDHYPRVEGGDKSKIFDRLKSYVGQKFKVKIINVGQEDEKLIVSEKAAVSEEISTTLEKLGAGKEVEGVVSGVVDFGVFVKFQEEGMELEGLVHISELAWQRVENPADFVALGEKVKAKVIGVDDGLRISLSIKQLQEDPWMTVAGKYKVGDKVKGEIIKVTPFGGFIKLDQEIHGLVHVSEMPDKAKLDPSKVLRQGEKMEFTIISLEPKEHRLGLSLKDGKTEPKKEEGKQSTDAKAKADEGKKSAKKAADEKPKESHVQPSHEAMAGTALKPMRDKEKVIKKAAKKEKSAAKKPAAKRKKKEAEKE